MWQTKYASAIPKNLGLGLNFRPCSDRLFPLWASVVRGFPGIISGWNFQFWFTVIGHGDNGPSAKPLFSTFRAEGHVTSTCLWHACRAVTIGALLIVMGMAMSILGKFNFNLRHTVFSYIYEYIKRATSYFAFQAC